jgi:hypothetical protein
MTTFQTGQHAVLAGTYVAQCHDTRVAMKIGRIFPACHTCRRPTTWNLIEVPSDGSPQTVTEQA